MATEFEQNILQSGACRLRECFFKHALARKTSKKLKKYLAKTFFFVYNKFIHGWIPEWPKGTDCKSAGDAFEGSNPSPSTTTPEHIRSGVFLSYAKAVRILLHPLLLQSIFALEFCCHTPKRFESFSIHYTLNSQVFSPGSFLSLFSVSAAQRPDTKRSFFALNTQPRGGAYGLAAIARIPGIFHIRAGGGALSEATMWPSLLHLLQISV